MSERLDPKTARFFEDVRKGYTAPPAPEVREAHLAAMAAQPIASAVRAPKLRRRRLATRGAAVATGLFVFGGSAMAATGNLPGPAQNAVANVAKHVGLDLPHGPKLGTKAAANKARADAFTDAKKAWVACVHEADQADDAETREACGPKPSPSDFGIPDKSPKPEKTTKPEKTDRPEKTDKAERTDRPEKTDKAEETDKAERTDRPEKTDKAERTPKPVRTPNENSGGPGGVLGE